MNEQQMAMDQQDTMSFKGQMAARYRERMSMGFTLSNNVTAEEFSPNLFTTVECANADSDHTQHKNATKGGDGQDLENHEVPINRIDVKTILPTGRSRSTMGRATFFPKPAMKDLITKFEKRSYTVHQLKRDQETDGGKNKFPETWSTQEDGKQMDLERIVTWTKGGALKNTSASTRMSPRLNAQNRNSENVSPKVVPQSTNDGRRNESLLGDQQSSSSRTAENDTGVLTMNSGITSRPLEENGVRNNDTEGIKSPGAENVIDPLCGPSSPLKRTSDGRESTRVSPENEHKMQSPLRISLRGLVNTKKNRDATKAEYVVHKKEWGNRYQTKVILGDESMFHVPYTVHEVHSKTKSDGGRSAMTTPSNTQQRIDKRHSHRCFDAKQDDQEAAGKDEKKYNAMQRYMKFLQHVTPPKPTASNDKFTHKPLSEVTTPRNESPHRTQIVRKLKKPPPKKPMLNAARSANHGNAAKARTKAFEFLANKKNSEKSGQYSKIKSRLMMPKKSANKQSLNNEPIPERKKPPERKKIAKTKVIVKQNVTKSDASGGDNAANAMTNSTVSITSSLYEELHPLNAPARNGSLKSGKPVLSRLPRSKLLTKTRPKLQELEAKTPTQSNSCTSNNYPTLDHENGDNMEGNKLEGFISSLRGCSTPEQTPEAESFRSSLTLRSSIRSEGDLSTYPVEFRGTVSPLKESNGCRSKSSPVETRKAKMVNSPKDIRKKLFEMMDKDVTNISEAILTEDELADNDLIPCHLRDRRVQSPIYLSCNEKIHDPQFAHQIHAPKSQTKRRKFSASPNSKDVAGNPRNPARDESSNTEKNNNTKDENSSPTQKAYPGVRSPSHELRGQRGPNSSRKKKVSKSVKGLTLTESSKDDVMVNLDSVNPDSKKNVGGNALSKKPTSRLAKKGDNSNFNIPPEECMSFLTIEDEDRSVYEDRLATPNPNTQGPHGEEVVAYQGFLHKHGGHNASPLHSPRQRTRRDIKSYGLSGSYNETHISSMGKVSIREASKDIARELATRSRRTTEDTLMDVCKYQEPPANHYHFGDSETKLDDSSDDGKKDKSPGSSPQKKRRRLEKPIKQKRKKIRRVVESNDEDTEISHSLPIDDRIVSLQKSLRESKLKDKRKDKPLSFVGNLKRIVSNTSLMVSKQNTPEQLRSKTGDDVTTVLQDRSRPSQRTMLELSPVRTSTYDDKRAMKRQSELADISPLLTKKTLSHLDQYSMVKCKNSFMEGSLSTSSALPLKDKDSLRDQQTSQWNDTQTADYSYMELPRIQPVRRLSSGPTGGFHNKSAIPLRTDSPNAPRKRADLLIQYRRWRESLMDCSRPSKIPLSEKFRRALDSAVIEEWAMHCWLPNHDIYLDAHDPWWCSPYDLVSDEETMSTSMISDVSGLGRDRWGDGVTTSARADNRWTAVTHRESIWNGCGVGALASRNLTDRLDGRVGGCPLCNENFSGYFKDVDSSVFLLWSYLDGRHRTSDDVLFSTPSGHNFCKSASDLCKHYSCVLNTYMARVFSECFGGTDDDATSSRDTFQCLNNERASVENEAMFRDSSERRAAGRKLKENCVWITMAIGGPRFNGSDRNVLLRVSLSHPYVVFQPCGVSQPCVVFQPCCKARDWHWILNNVEDCQNDISRDMKMVSAQETVHPWDRKGYLFLRQGHIYLSITLKRLCQVHSYKKSSCYQKKIDREISCLTGRTFTSQEHKERSYDDNWNVITRPVNRDPPSCLMLITPDDPTRALTSFYDSDCEIMTIISTMRSKTKEKNSVIFSSPVFLVSFYNHAPEKACTELIIHDIISVSGILAQCIICVYKQEVTVAAWLVLSQISVTNVPSTFLYSNETTSDSNNNSSHINSDTTRIDTMRLIGNTRLLLISKRPHLNPSGQGFCKHTRKRRPHAQSRVTATNGLKVRRSRRNRKMNCTKRPNRRWLVIDSLIQLRRTGTNIMSVCKQETNEASGIQTSFQHGITDETRPHPCTWSGPRLLHWCDRSPVFGRNNNSRRRAAASQISDVYENQVKSSKWPRNLEQSMDCASVWSQGSDDKLTNRNEPKRHQQESTLSRFQDDPLWMTRREKRDLREKPWKRVTTHGLGSSCPLVEDMAVVVNKNYHSSQTPFLCGFDVPDDAQFKDVFEKDSDFPLTVPAQKCKGINRTKDENSQRSSVHGMEMFLSNHAQGGKDGDDSFNYEEFLSVPFVPDIHPVMATRKQQINVQTLAREVTSQNKDNQARSGVMTQQATEFKTRMDNPVPDNFKQDPLSANDSMNLARAQSLLKIERSKLARQRSKVGLIKCCDQRLNTSPLYAAMNADRSKRTAANRCDETDTCWTSPTLNEDTTGSKSQARDRKARTTKAMCTRTLMDPKIAAEMQKKVKAIVQSYKEFLKGEAEQHRDDARETNDCAKNEYKNTGGTMDEKMGTFSRQLEGKINDVQYTQPVKGEEVVRQVDEHVINDILTSREFEDLATINPRSISEDGAATRTFNLRKSIMPAKYKEFPDVVKCELNQRGKAVQGVNKPNISPRIARCLKQSNSSLKHIGPEPWKDAEKRSLRKRPIASEPPRFFINRFSSPEKKKLTRDSKPFANAVPKRLDFPKDVQNRQDQVIKTHNNVGTKNAQIAAKFSDDPQQKDSFIPAKCNEGPLTAGFLSHQSPEDRLAQKQKDEAIMAKIKENEFLTCLIDDRNRRKRQETVSVAMDSRVNPSAQHITSGRHEPLKKMAAENVKPTKDSKLTNGFVDTTYPAETWDKANKDPQHCKSVYSAHELKLSTGQFRKPNLGQWESRDQSGTTGLKVKDTRTNNGRCEIRNVQVSLGQKPRDQKPRNQAPIGYKVVTAELKPVVESLTNGKTDRTQKDLIQTGRTQTDRIQNDQVHSYQILTNNIHNSRMQTDRIQTDRIQTYCERKELESTECVTMKVNSSKTYPSKIATVGNVQTVKYSRIPIRTCYLSGSRAKLAVRRQFRCAMTTKAKEAKSRERLYSRSRTAQKKQIAPSSSPFNPVKNTGKSGPKRTEMEHVALGVPFYTSPGGQLKKTKDWGFGWSRAATTTVSGRGKLDLSKTRGVGDGQLPLGKSRGVGGGQLLLAKARGVGEGWLEKKAQTGVSKLTSSKREFGANLHIPVRQPTRVLMSAAPTCSKTLPSKSMLVTGQKQDELVPNFHARVADQTNQMAPAVQNLSKRIKSAPESQNDEMSKVQIQSTLPADKAKTAVKENQWKLNLNTSSPVKECLGDNSGESMWSSSDTSASPYTSTMETNYSSSPSPTSWGSSEFATARHSYAGNAAEGMEATNSHVSRTSSWNLSLSKSECRGNANVAWGDGDKREPVAKDNLAERAPNLPVKVPSGGSGAAPMFSAESDVLTSANGDGRTERYESSLSTMRSIPELPYNYPSSDELYSPKFAAVSSKILRKRIPPKCLGRERKSEVNTKLIPEKVDYNFSNRKLHRASSEPNLTTSTRSYSANTVRASRSLTSAGSLLMVRREFPTPTNHSHSVYESVIKSRNSSAQKTNEDCWGKKQPHHRRKGQKRKIRLASKSISRTRMANTDSHVTHYHSGIREKKRSRNRSQNKPKKFPSFPHCNCLYVGNPEIAAHSPYGHSTAIKYSPQSAATRDKRRAFSCKKRAALCDTEGGKANADDDPKDTISIKIKKSLADVVRCSEKSKDSPRSLPGFSTILNFWESQESILSLGKAFQNIFKGIKNYTVGRSEAEQCSIKHSSSDMTTFHSLTEYENFDNPIVDELWPKHLPKDWNLKPCTSCRYGRYRADGMYGSDGRHRADERHRTVWKHGAGVSAIESMSPLRQASHAEKGESDRRARDRIGERLEATVTARGRMLTETSSSEGAMDDGDDYEDCHVTTRTWYNPKQKRFYKQFVRGCKKSKRNVDDGNARRKGGSEEIAINKKRGENKSIRILRGAKHRLSNYNGTKYAPVTTSSTCSDGNDFEGLPVISHCHDLQSYIPECDVIQFEPSVKDTGIKVNLQTEMARLNTVEPVQNTGDSSPSVVDNDISWKEQNEEFTKFLSSRTPRKALNTIWGRGWSRGLEQADTRKHQQRRLHAETMQGITQAETAEKASSKKDMTAVTRESMVATHYDQQQTRRPTRSIKETPELTSRASTESEPIQRSGLEDFLDFSKRSGKSASETDVLEILKQRRELENDKNLTMRVPPNSIEKLCEIPGSQGRTQLNINIKGIRENKIQKKGLLSAEFHHEQASGRTKCMDTNEPYDKISGKSHSVSVIKTHRISSFDENIQSSSVTEEGQPMDSQDRLQGWQRKGGTKSRSLPQEACSQRPGHFKGFPASLAGPKELRFIKNDRELDKTYFGRTSAKSEPMLNRHKDRRNVNSSPNILQLYTGWDTLDKSLPVNQVPENLRDQESVETIVSDNQASTNVARAPQPTAASDQMNHGQSTGAGTPKPNQGFTGGDGVALDFGNLDMDEDELEREIYVLLLQKYVFRDLAKTSNRSKLKGVKMHSPLIKGSREHQKTLKCLLRFVEEKLMQDDYFDEAESELPSPLHMAGVASDENKEIQFKNRQAVTGNVRKKNMCGSSGCMERRSPENFAGRQGQDGALNLNQVNGDAKPGGSKRMDITSVDHAHCRSCIVCDSSAPGSTHLKIKRAQQNFSVPAVSPRASTRFMSDKESSIRAKLTLIQSDQVQPLEPKLSKHASTQVIVSEMPKEEPSLDAAMKEGLQNKLINQSMSIKTIYSLLNESLGGDSKLVAFKPSLFVGNSPFICTDHLDITGRTNHLDRNVRTDSVENLDDYGRIDQNRHTDQTEQGVEQKLIRTGAVRVVSMISTPRKLSGKFDSPLKTSVKRPTVCRSITAMTYSVHSSANVSEVSSLKNDIEYLISTGLDYKSDSSLKSTPVAPKKRNRLRKPSHQQNLAGNVQQTSAAAAAAGRSKTLMHGGLDEERVKKESKRQHLMMGESHLMSTKTFHGSSLGGRPLATEVGAPSTQEKLPQNLTLRSNVNGGSSMSTSTTDLDYRKIKLVLSTSPLQRSVALTSPSCLTSRKQTTTSDIDTISSLTLEVTDPSQGETQSKFTQVYFLPKDKSDLKNSPKRDITWKGTKLRGGHLTSNESTKEASSQVTSITDDTAPLTRLGARGVDKDSSPRKKEVTMAVDESSGTSNDNMPERSLRRSKPRRNSSRNQLNLDDENHAHRKFRSQFTSSRVETPSLGDSPSTEKEPSDSSRQLSTGFLDQTDNKPTVQSGVNQSTHSSEKSSACFYQRWPGDVAGRTRASLFNEIGKLTENIVIPPSSRKDQGMFYQKATLRRAKTYSETLRAQRQESQLTSRKSPRKSRECPDSTEQVSTPQSHKRKSSRHYTLKNSNERNTKPGTVEPLKLDKVRGKRDKRWDSPHPKLSGGPLFSQLETFQGDVSQERKTRTRQAGLFPGNVMACKPPQGKMGSNDAHAQAGKTREEFKTTLSSVVLPSTTTSGCPTADSHQTRENLKSKPQISCAWLELRNEETIILEKIQHAILPKPYSQVDQVKVDLQNPNGQHPMESPICHGEKKLRGKRSLTSISNIRSSSSRQFWVTPRHTSPLDHPQKSPFGLDSNGRAVEKLTDRENLKLKQQKRDRKLSGSSARHSAPTLYNGRVSSSYKTDVIFPTVAAAKFRARCDNFSDLNRSNKTDAAQSSRTTLSRFSSWIESRTQSRHALNEDVVAGAKIFVGRDRTHAQRKFTASTPLTDNQFYKHYWSALQLNDKFRRPVADLERSRKWIVKNVCQYNTKTRKSKRLNRDKYNSAAMDMRRMYSTKGNSDESGLKRVSDIQCIHSPHTMDKDADTPHIMDKGTDSPHTMDKGADDPHKTDKDAVSNSLNKQKTVQNNEAKKCRSRDVEIIIGSDIPVEEFTGYLMAGLQQQFNDARLPGQGHDQQDNLKCQVRLVIDKIFGDGLERKNRGATRAVSKAKIQPTVDSASVAVAADNNNNLTSSETNAARAVIRNGNNSHMAHTLKRPVAHLGKHKALLASAQCIKRRGVRNNTPLKCKTTALNSINENGSRRRPKNDVTYSNKNDTSLTRDKTTRTGIGGGDHGALKSWRDGTDSVRKVTGINGHANTSMYAQQGKANRSASDSALSVPSVRLYKRRHVKPGAKSHHDKKMRDDRNSKAAGADIGKVHLRKLAVETLTIKKPHDFNLEKIIRRRNGVTVTLASPTKVDNIWPGAEPLKISQDKSFSPTCSSEFAKLLKRQNVAQHKSTHSENKIKNPTTEHTSKKCQVNMGEEHRRYAQQKIQQEKFRRGRFTLKMKQGRRLYDTLLEKDSHNFFIHKSDRNFHESTTEADSEGDRLMNETDRHRHRDHRQTLSTHKNVSTRPRKALKRRDFSIFLSPKPYGKKDVGTTAETSSSSFAREPKSKKFPEAKNKVTSAQHLGAEDIDVFVDSRGTDQSDLLSVKRCCPVLKTAKTASTSSDVKQNDKAISLNSSSSHNSDNTLAEMDELTRILRDFLSRRIAKRSPVTRESKDKTIRSQGSHLNVNSIPEKNKVTERRQDMSKAPCKPKEFETNDESKQHVISSLACGSTGKKQASEHLTGSRNAKEIIPKDAQTANENSVKVSSKPNLDKKPPTSPKKPIVSKSKGDLKKIEEVEHADSERSTEEEEDVTSESQTKDSISPRKKQLETSKENEGKEEKSKVPHRAQSVALRPPIENKKLPERDLQRQTATSVNPNMDSSKSKEQTVIKELPHTQNTVQDSSAQKEKIKASPGIECTPRLDGSPISVCTRPPNMPVAREFKLKAPCSLYTLATNVNVSLSTYTNRRGSLKKAVRLTVPRRGTAPPYEVSIEPNSDDDGPPKIIAENGYVHVSFEKDKKSERESEEDESGSTEKSTEESETTAESSEESEESKESPSPAKPAPTINKNSSKVEQVGHYPGAPKTRRLDCLGVDLAQDSTVLKTQKQAHGKANDGDDLRTLQARRQDSRDVNDNLRHNSIEHQPQNSRTSDVSFLSSLRHHSNSAHTGAPTSDRQTPPEGEKTNFRTGMKRFLQRISPIKPEAIYPTFLSTHLRHTFSRNPRLTSQPELSTEPYPSTSYDSSPQAFSLAFKRDSQALSTRREFWKRPSFKDPATPYTLLENSAACMQQETRERRPLSSLDSSSSYSPIRRLSVQLPEETVDYRRLPKSLRGNDSYLSYRDDSSHAESLSESDTLSSISPINYGKTFTLSSHTERTPSAGFWHRDESSPERSSSSRSHTPVPLSSRVLRRVYASSPINDSLLSESFIAERSSLLGKEQYFPVSTRETIIPSSWSSDRDAFWRRGQEGVSSNNPETRFGISGARREYSGEARSRVMDSQADRYQGNRPSRFTEKRQDDPRLFTGEPSGEWRRDPWPADGFNNISHAVDSVYSQKRLGGMESKDIDFGRFASNAWSGNYQNEYHTLPRSPARMMETTIRSRRLSEDAKAFTTRDNSNQTLAPRRDTDQYTSTKEEISGTMMTEDLPSRLSVVGDSKHRTRSEGTPQDPAQEKQSPQSRGEGEDKTGPDKEEVFQSNCQSSSDERSSYCPVRQSSLASSKSPRAGLYRVRFSDQVEQFSIPVEDPAPPNPNTDKVFFDNQTSRRVEKVSYKRETNSEATSTARAPTRRESPKENRRPIASSRSDEWAEGLGSGFSRRAAPDRETYAHSRRTSPISRSNLLWKGGKLSSLSHGYFRRSEGMVNQDGGTVAGTKLDSVRRKRKSFEKQGWTTDPNYSYSNASSCEHSVADKADSGYSTLGTPNDLTAVSEWDLAIQQKLAARREKMTA